MIRRLAALALLALSVVGVARAQEQQTPDGVWSLLERQPQAAQAGPGWIRPRAGQALALNANTLRALLASAPLEFTPQAQTAPLIVQLPDPGGALQSFALVESPIMDRAMAASLPGVKTYAGQGLDDKTATLRMDISPTGLRAQVLSARGHWYIDPFTQGDSVHHTSYYKRDLANMFRWQCQNSELADPDARERTVIATAERAGPTLRTFRAAVACTGEYAQFHGGTVSAAQSAIVTVWNRVNGVYEREFAVRMTLVNNASIVYTNPGTDPYTNVTNVDTLNTNQNVIDAQIGQPNYDVGHVVSTGGGGVAWLASVCSESNKAKGTTGLPVPVGDPFAIDYVCHELGHQFGANHTFNGINGACGPNRAASAAYEPGSGSCIMGYTGICGPDDLQINSDAMFHSGSFDEVISYIESLSCPATTTTGNTAPAITSITPNRTIPRGTPFTLTATASDSPGQGLTYSWEQRTLGAASALNASDDGSIPLFRVYAPVTRADRTFPRWDVILNNSNVDPTNHEKLPNLPRTMPFRLTVRDNAAGGGGVNTADTTITVAGNSGPFRVTSPNTAVARAGTLNVTWDVAGTIAAPVNCSAVDVLLSIDGGLTFPTFLAQNVPNTGSVDVLLPSISTSTARVMVRAVGNIFFDVSDVNFPIQPPPDGVVFAGGNPALDDLGGNGNANGRIDPGENAIRIFIPLRNDGLTTATGVTTDLSTSTPNVSIISGTSTYPTLAFAQSAVNQTPFVIAVSPDLPCGQPIQFALNINSGQGSGVYSFTLPTGLSAGLGPVQTFSWTGLQEIPDNSTVGTSVTQNVAGVNGTVGKVQFRFDGNTCSTAVAATGVGLQHSFVGDLVVTLISPSGTQVKLLNRVGGTPPGSSGNNFCQTLLRDDATIPSIQTITSSSAPATGNFQPAEPLTAFIGEPANGVWTLRVQDLNAGDVGRLRAFSILIQPQTTTLCQPPDENAGLCDIDYNQDLFISLDDLADFIVDYYTTPAIPGGNQPLAPSYPSINIGYGVPCPNAPDAPAPYSPSAYRQFGYRVGFSQDLVNRCPGAPNAPFPNLDNLGDYITAYYAGCQ
jgi:subtilisin-like proprotein convertase family protein